MFLFCFISINIFMKLTYMFMKYFKILYKVCKILLFLEIYLGNEKKFLHNIKALQRKHIIKLIFQVQGQTARKLGMGLAVVIFSIYTSTKIQIMFRKYNLT